MSIKKYPTRVVGEINLSNRQQIKSAEDLLHTIILRSWSFILVNSNSWDRNKIMRETTSRSLRTNDSIVMSLFLRLKRMLLSSVGATYFS